MDSATKDLGSVLTHIETLQKQLLAKDNELKEAKQREEESKQREEEARRQAQQLNSVNMKLTEAKRESMQEEFNGKVREWVKSLDDKLVPDTLKQEFLTSCKRFADSGDETGVWKVVCCASAAHQHQVNTIQKLTEDYNTLKKTVDGQFSGEESRKRKEMEPTTVPSVPSVWDQLEGMCKAY